MGAQGFWLPVRSDHAFLFIAMGEKSAPACHLVKHRIGKATLSPKELKLAGFKLGDRRMLWTFFLGNVSFQFRTGCGHPGEHCPGVRGGSSQGPRVCRELLSSVWPPPVSVSRWTPRASGLLFCLSKRSLTSLKLRAATLSDYIWRWCSWKSVFITLFAAVMWIGNKCLFG